MLVAATLLAVVAACGGGGGGSSFARQPGDPPPGIQGTAILVGTDLGRLSEQEPNDSPEQSYRLPPVGVLTHVDVTGTVGTTVGWFGRADPVDAFRYQVQGTQEVTLTLDHLPEDPLGAGANRVQVAVYEHGTGDLLAQTSGFDLPRSIRFRPDAGVVVDVVVTCTTGHTPYVLGFDAAHLGAPAKPEVSPLQQIPTSDLGVASRIACPDGACSASRLIVRLKPGADAAAVAARLGMEIEGRTATGSLRLRVSATGETGAQKMQSMSAATGADPDVAWAEPDWMVQPCGTVNDPDFNRQWNLTAIGAPAAWDITKGDESVVIGVIDTGIIPHPDLEGQIVGGYDFISDPLVSGDGDSLLDTDPTDPGDLAYSTGLSSWHGTHVSTILAARADDGYGIAGVAPGCKIMPLRALGIGGGLVSDVANAILYAAGLWAPPGGVALEKPLRIVNMSLGLSMDSRELEEACTLAEAQGVLLIAAAGNGGHRGTLYPARYENVIAVSAVDAHMNTTAYSNFGESIDLAAPGGVGEADLPGDGWPDGILGGVYDDTLYPVKTGHTYLEGTSQATPHVAGTAALLLSANPDLTLSDLRRYLLFSALDRGASGRDDVYGRGVVQAHEALKLMLYEKGEALTAAPRLLLANSCVEFHGFQTWHEIPVLNAGGGTLILQAPIAVTDSGVPWLSAANDLVVGSGPSNVYQVIASVNRTSLPDEEGHYAGTIFVRDETGTVGTVRVTLHVRSRLRAGLEHSIVARDASNGGVVARASVSPARGYRYWFPSLLPGTYKLMAGTDIDGDGFFCEGGDACGWFGGPTEAEAALVQLYQDQTILGAEIHLRQP